jgi:hypothetical protein
MDRHCAPPSFLVKLIFRHHLVLRLINGSVPPLLLMPSWHAQQQLYFHGLWKLSYCYNVPFVKHWDDFVRKVYLIASVDCSMWSDVRSHETSALNSSRPTGRQAGWRCICASGSHRLCLLLQYLHILAVKSCQGRHYVLSTEFPEGFCEKRLCIPSVVGRGLFNLYHVALSFFI